MIDAVPIDLRLASDADDRRGALRLRYRVFVEECGGTGPGIDHRSRTEADPFDAHADYLILVDPRADPAGGDHVLGTTRLLAPEAAARAGGYYGAGEYDLAPLHATGRRLLELGRTCLAPEIRGSDAMLRLWQGVARYVLAHRIQILFGVASLPGTDPAPLAAPLSLLHHRHLAPPPLRVRARAPGGQRMDLVPAAALDRIAAVKALPPLIKSYLRLGGVVGEGAFIDRAFNTTDVCLVLDTAAMPPAQRARFAGPPA